MLVEFKNLGIIFGEDFTYKYSLLEQVINDNNSPIKNTIFLYLMTYYWIEDNYINIISEMEKLGII